MATACRRGAAYQGLRLPADYSVQCDWQSGFFSHRNFSRTCVCAQCEGWQELLDVWVCTGGVVLLVIYLEKKLQKTSYQALPFLSLLKHPSPHFEVLSSYFVFFFVWASRSRHYQVPSGSNERSNLLFHSSFWLRNCKITNSCHKALTIFIYEIFTVI